MLCNSDNLGGGKQRRKTSFDSSDAISYEIIHSLKLQKSVALSREVSQAYGKSDEQLLDMLDWHFLGHILYICALKGSVCTQCRLLA